MGSRGEIPNRRAAQFVGTGDWSDGWSKSSATAPPTIVVASCESQSAVSGVQGSSTDEASSMEGDTTSSSGGKRKWGVKR